MFKLLVRRLTLTVSPAFAKTLLADVIILSITLSFAMLFPVVYLRGIGQLLVAGYDYSLNWIDESSMQAVREQSFFERALLVSRQSDAVVEANRREAVIDLDVCDARTHQDLYYFTKRALVSRADETTAQPTVSICLDTAEELHVAAGDTVRVGGAVDAVVDAVYESAYSESDVPLALITYQDFGYKHMPEITCAYLKTTNAQEAERYFRNEFIGPDAAAQDIPYFRHVDNTSRQADIEAAQEEAFLGLGIVIALSALSAVLLVVFSLRESLLRFAQHESEYKTLARMGLSGTAAFQSLVADSVLRYALAMLVSAPVACKFVFPLLANAFLSWRSVLGFVLLFLCAVLCSAAAAALINTRRLFGFQVEGNA